MRPEPELSPGAQADVLDAARLYDAASSDLGQVFLNEFASVLSRIREAPLLSTVVDSPVRRLLMRRFPFGVFYVPGAEATPDVVLAVIDLRQDPEVVRRAYQR